MVDMEGTRIDGGDNSIVMILVGGVIQGADVEGIGLRHCKGSGKVVDVKEMGVTTRGAGMEASGVV